MKKLLIPPLICAIGSTAIFAYPIPHLTTPQQMLMSYSVGLFLAMTSLHLLFKPKKRSQSDSKQKEGVATSEFWSK